VEPTLEQLDEALRQAGYAIPTGENLA
jgi:hypothetical protein